MGTHGKRGICPILLRQTNGLLIVHATICFARKRFFFFLREAQRIALPCLVLGPSLSQRKQEPPNHMAAAAAAATTAKHQDD